MKHWGFSLVEGVILAAVLSVLSIWAIPAYQNWTATNQALAASDAFLAAVRLARSQAIQRTTTVCLCAANASQSGCLTGSGSPTSWDEGWLVFVNAADNCIYNANADTLIQQQPRFAQSGALDASSGANLLSYNDQGLIVQGGNSQYDFKPVGCPQHATGRRIQINAIGSPTAHALPCS